MGGFAQWRAGFENTVETAVTSVSATKVTARKASVEVALKAVDVDACGDRVTQRFAGSWVLTKGAGRWTATALRINKTSGNTPKTAAGDCEGDQAPAPEDESPAPPEEPATQCDPNYEGACLDPAASDYDCAGGSGNGPEYTGRVEVVGDDPFGLDADGDGVGCE